MCTHLWEVTGNQHPVVRCSLCNLKWWGLPDPAAIDNLGAFDVVRDALLRFAESQELGYLQQARATWQFWTREGISIESLVKLHKPRLLQWSGQKYSGVGTKIGCTCGWRATGQSDIAMCMTYSSSEFQ